MADLLNTNIGPERVQVFQVPLGSTQVPGVSTDTTAFLVATDFAGAPVNTPTLITDTTTFETTFGTADNFFFDGYYAVQGYYDNAGLGANALIVNVGDGVHQVSTVTTIADTSGSLAGTYFTINSGRNQQQYYLWFQVSGTGTDPKPTGLTGIQVNITTNATANTVASAINTAFASAPLSNYFTSTVSTDEVTITNSQGGASTPVADGSSPDMTGFTFGTTTTGANPTAAQFIGNSALGTGLRALDVIDIVGMVTVPGLPISEAYLVDPATIDYALTVRAEFGATLSTTFSLVAIPKEITTSQTDVTVVTATIATVSGNMVTFSGTPDLTNIVPGYVLNHSGAFVGTITAVNTGTYQVTLTTVGTLATGNTVQLSIPSAITYKEKVVNVPSFVNGWYYNNVLVLDASVEATPGELYTSSPVGHVAGVIARIDANTAIGGVSHAPAGLQFAGISGIQGLNLTVSERFDAGPLRLNFINRITSFPGAGNVIFGGYTGDSGTSPIYTSDEELIQVMRTLQFIKASLEPGLRSFLWENFSPVTQAQIVQAINAFLVNNIYLFPAGLPQNQQFNIISVTPTQTELNQGLLRVRVQIRPNQALRFIEVDLEFPLSST